MIDILGVSDLEVWRYGQTLRQMATDCQCDHIKFYRLRNFLDSAECGAPLTEGEYLKDAPLFRNEMLARYLPDNFDPATIVAEDADTTCTYRGYIKFLETDLAHRVFEGDVKTKGQFKKENEDIARRMIVRGKVSILQSDSDSPPLTTICRPSPLPLRKTSRGTSGSRSIHLQKRPSCQCL